MPGEPEPRQIGGDSHASDSPSRHAVRRNRKRADVHTQAAAAAERRRLARQDGVELNLHGRNARLGRRTAKETTRTRPWGEIGISVGEGPHHGQLGRFLVSVGFTRDPVRQKM
jgi:hypothetical protein